MRQCPPLSRMLNLGPGSDVTALGVSALLGPWSVHRKVMWTQRTRRWPSRLCEGLAGTQL